MFKKIFSVWTIFWLVTLILGVYFFIKPNIQNAGDIAEYYGISETLINHGSLELRDTDKENLSKALSPGYYEDPQYYIEAKDGNRYPVHFILYSFLTIPARLILRLLGQNELLTFTFTNLAIFTAVNFVILKKFIQKTSKQYLFLLLTYLSPFIYFITWPGADLFTMSLLMLSCFYFYSNKYMMAILLATLASWQSQPLVVVPLLYLAYYLISKIQVHELHPKKEYSILHEVIIKGLGLLAIMLIPNIYNYLIFGVFSPWSLFESAHKVTIANVTFKKLSELILDLNIGLFWYVPVIVTLGFSYILYFITEKKNALIFTAFVLAGILYATNSNWNNGTAGYGPSRYAIFMLPFLIFFSMRMLRLLSTKLTVVVLTLFVLTQLFVLSFNSLRPNFYHTLFNTPYAIFAYNRFPALYNPTPEIFIERTLHYETPNAETVVYKKNNDCTKAYVLKTVMQPVLNDCTFIPTKNLKFFENDMERIASFPRTVETIEATLWPDSKNCQPGQPHTYICLNTLQDVKAYTTIQEDQRWENLYPGVWKLKKGTSIEMTVPPGYRLDYYSTEGTYVNY